jgi:sugar/nucleoside kinase (ribokinase family)
VDADSQANAGNLTPHHPDTLSPQHPVTPSPDFVAYSGLIIDDIVLANGRTFFNTLGGAATHALAGMRIWSDSLGYFAAVGDDFDPAHRQLLEAMGVDLRGLITRQGHPTARAWQLFEPDERRIEVFRTEIEDFYRMEPGLEEMPHDYLAARGFHIHHGTLADSIAVVARLREVNPAATIVWEPTPLQHTGAEEDFRAILALVNLVSPDLSEARAMTGQESADAAIETLLAWGAPVVALRLGSHGSRVETAGGASFQVPAVPATVVDTTGAGDAYCGGFLVALADMQPLAETGARAAVSASFAVEQFGTPVFDEQTRAEAERRLAWAREHVVARGAV